jgi:hypothetical protein
MGSSVLDPYERKSKPKRFRVAMLDPCADELLV